MQTIASSIQGIKADYATSLDPVSEAMTIRTEHISSHIPQEMRRKGVLFCLASAGAPLSTTLIPKVKADS